MLKKSFYLIGSLVFYIIPPYVFKKLNSIFCWIYSGYQSRLLSKCGDGFYIHENSTILGGKYISIGNSVNIGRRAILTVWDTIEYKPYLFIGDNTIIGDDCHITAINKVVIGSNVLMGKKITITDNSHGKELILDNKTPPIYRELYSKGPVVVGDNVWIGDKSTILPGVIIGHNSIIGANSVVTKNIPSNCIAVGNPAKIINQV